MTKRGRKKVNHIYPANNYRFLPKAQWLAVKNSTLFLMVVMQMLVGMNVDRIFVSVRMGMNKIVCFK